MVFVKSPVGVLEVAVHAVKEMAFLCDSLSVSHRSRNEGKEGGTAFIELLGMSAEAGPPWEGSHQDHMLMYYFLYEGY